MCINIFIYTYITPRLKVSQGLFPMGRLPMYGLCVAIRQEASLKTLGCDGRMSLCCMCLDATDVKSTCLVHWKDVSQMLGQPVRTDSQGRAIMALAGLRAEDCWRDFKSCEVILPDSGAWMRKATRGDRPQVPAHVLRLKDMCTLAEQHAPGRACAPEFAKCFVCDKAEMPSCDGPHKCPWCLIVSHPNCLFQLIGPTFRKLKSVNMTYIGLPSVLNTTTICHLCAGKVKLPTRIL